MGNFLQSTVGSYVKALLTIIVAYMVKNGTVLNLEWAHFANAIMISFLPVAIKMIKAEGGFFNTAVGGYVKAFVIIVLSYVAAQGDIFSISWSNLFDTVLVAFLPILINVVNPEDARYGIKKKD